MKQIINFLQSMPDKLAHLLICLIGSFFFSFFFGFGASVAAEYKDYVHGGSWSWADFACGLIGSAIGGLVQFLILRDIWLTFK